MLPGRQALRLEVLHGRLAEICAAAGGQAKRASGGLPPLGIDPYEEASNQSDAGLSGVCGGWSSARFRRRTRPYTRESAVPVDAFFTHPAPPSLLVGKLASGLA